MCGKDRETRMAPPSCGLRVLLSPVGLAQPDRCGSPVHAVLETVQIFNCVIEAAYEVDMAEENERTVGFTSIFSAMSVVRTEFRKLWSRRR